VPKNVNTSSDLHARRSLWSGGILAAALIVLLAFFATLWGDAALNIREILTATSFGPQGRLVEPLSFADGEHTRNLVIPTAPDSRWWIMHAERMARTGEWRIRSTGNDNAPDGREVHWSSLPTWNLAILGKLLSSWNPRPDLSPIEWAALFVGPVTLLLFFLIGIVICQRNFGWAVTVAFPLAVLAARSLQFYFRAGEADHHGLVSMFAMLGMLLLVARRFGLGGLGQSRSSRADFVWAGVMSAAGLWVSAASQLPVIASTGLGALIATWMVSRQAPRTLDPSVWRIWGFSAALASLGFYILEYFPAHMGWRLEVNHPVYALAWAAGGEILCLLTRWMKDGHCPVQGLRGAVWVGALFMVSALPVILVVLGGEQFFVISNKFLYALHDYFINEFQSVLDVSKGLGLHYALYAFSFSLAAALIAALALVKIKPAAGDSAVIVFAAVPAVVMTALAFHQIRWSGVAAAMTIPLIMACFASLHSQRSPAPRWRRAAAWMILMLAAATSPATVWMRYEDGIGSENMVDKSQAPSVLTRDICQRIAASASGTRPVILASPSSSTDIIYYGGAKGIGTLYWENLAGLEAGAKIYSAKKDTEALALIRKLGITHIILFSWDSFGQRYVRLDRGLGRDDEARDGFIAALLEGTRPQPVWLNPLFYPIPAEYKLGDDQWVRIYQVAPDQTRAHWFYHVGIYQLDVGKPELALRSFRESVALEPKQRDPWLAIIMLVASQGDTAALGRDIHSMKNALGTEGEKVLADAALQMRKAGQTKEAEILTRLPSAAR